MNQPIDIVEMQKWVDDFARERKWERYHTPKNLSMSIAIEAAELMEHFQWSRADEHLAAAADSPVAEEMADVLSYLLLLASVLNIDLGEALRAKMIKNAIKYPSDVEHRFDRTVDATRES